MFTKLRYFFLFIIFSGLITNHASARDQIRIVGSSTVFPFSTAVAEEFGNNTEFKTPVVESTGSGGGLKLFCNGVGLNHPDKKVNVEESEIDGLTPPNSPKYCKSWISFAGFFFIKKNVI